LPSDVTKTSQTLLQHRARDGQFLMHINDLKSLILMTVNYIDLTIELDRYLQEMSA